MENNGAPKYRIDTTLQGNTRMFSSGHILPGEQIIAESPLTSVPVALRDVYNANQALGDRSKFNVCPHLDEAYDQLSAEKQRAIQQLFRLRDDLLSVFACNSFEGEEKNGLYSHTVLRLFDDISRTNHSCRPNAVFDWDHNRNVGTLHALEGILPDTEIKIDYYPAEATHLRRGELRREDLRKQYGFECDCEACDESRQGDNNEDDMRRQKAARLWRSINKAEPHVNECEAQAVSRKLRQAGDYVLLLLELRILDLKLAHAWGRAAELQQESFKLADTDYHRQHCGCIDDRRRMHHLKNACILLSEETKIHICCWGAHHPDIRQDYENMTALLTKMMQYERRGWD